VRNFKQAMKAARKKESGTTGAKKKPAARAKKAPAPRPAAKR
jgi:hypothetical protein